MIPSKGDRPRKNTSPFADCGQTSSPQVKIRSELGAHRGHRKPVEGIIADAKTGQRPVVDKRLKGFSGHTGLANAATRQSFGVAASTAAGTS